MSDKIILKLNELEVEVNRLKKEGKKIVFTNGGFNILHVGHVRSLIEAKALGEVLVVAVNSDISLKKIKGKNYPIIPEAERIEILQALSCTDIVTLFNEKTADSLLETLKPHFYAKGTDYSPDTIPETKTVLSYGGQVMLVGDSKDHASSDIVKRIKKAAIEEFVST